MLCSLFMLMTISYFTSLSSSATLSNNRNHPYSSSLKLSLADSAESTEYHIREPEGPGTYSFGFEVEDSQVSQFRTEERHANGTVQGSYGYLTPEGTVHIVHYVADHLGYRTKIEESRKIKSPNKNYNSLQAFQDNISPQMIAALQSLESHNNKFEKEDHRVRPIDEINSRLRNPVNVLGGSVKENQQEENNTYKIYFVPPN